MVKIINRQLQYKTKNIMKKETLVKFAKAHKESPGLSNKINLDYDKFVKDVFKEISKPEFKEGKFYKHFVSFFDEQQFKTDIQMALQFQAGIDFLIWTIKNKDKNV